MPAWLKAPLLLLCLLLIRQNGLAVSASMNFGSGIEIIKGPFLQYPLPSAGTMAVVWETSFPSQGALLYGETKKYTKKIPSSKIAARHKVILQNLDPGKEYHYRIEAGSRFSRDYAFRPFPANEKNYTFLLYGDTRYNHPAHQGVVEEMKKYDADFILHTGDMVTHGSSLNEWDIFFFIIRPIAARIPLFPVIGNHEYWKGGSGIYKSIFFLPENSKNPTFDYYFDTGNARFIIMDNRFIGKKKGEQKVWLEGVLKEARENKKFSHVFVCLHQGIESSGPHGPDKRLEKHGYVELMKTYDVTLVFGGHDHIYERGVASGLRYMVSGGGGAPVYTKEKPTKNTQLRASERHFVWFSVEDETVKFKVVRPDGSMIEACSLSKKGYACGPGAG